MLPYIEGNLILHAWQTATVSDPVRQSTILGVVFFFIYISAQRRGQFAVGRFFCVFGCKRGCNWPSFEQVSLLFRFLCQIWIFRVRWATWETVLSTRRALCYLWAHTGHEFWPSHGNVGRAQWIGIFWAFMWWGGWGVVYTTMAANMASVEVLDRWREVWWACSFLNSWC